MKIVYRKNLDTLSVDPIQAREAIRRAGLLEAVETYINAPETDPLVKSAWEYALTFKRTSPTILAVATAMGWSDQELDGLFIAASQIEY
jgi:hypothetical protein